MKFLRILRYVFIALLFLSMQTEVSKPKIYIIGDSTVSTYNSGYFPMAGWGQELHYFLNSDSVTVINKAIGGRSSKSFYRDHWAPIRDALEPGDYVFVQFGINDRNSSDTSRYAPVELFKDYLTKFVTETQEKGATCALVSTVRRNSWNATAPPTMYDAWHEHPVATRELAAELNVPLIDLDQADKDLMEPLGPEYTGPFLYMNLETGEYPNYPGGRNDDTHFQEMGSIENARLVIQEIEGLGDFPEMAKLIPFINPMHEVTVTCDKPDETIITRSASYPKGIFVTLKTKPALGFDLLEWQDVEGNVRSTENIFRFKMDTTALAFHALIGVHRDSIVIQEDEIGFCGVDGAVENIESGFTGTGYAATVDTAGTGIGWQIEVAKSGTYQFVWRYANGMDGLVANLLINDVPVLDHLNFQSTTDWTSWDSISVDVELDVGMQEIRLEAVSENGLAHIDFFHVAGSVVKPADCGSKSVISREIYRIINKASGKALEITDASSTNAASVQQGAYVGGKHQQWQVIHVEDNYYSLVAQHSGQYLDVYGKRTTDGADAIQYPSNGGFNQQWAVTDVDSVWFTIKARHSGMCLEVANGSTSEGANVQQWTDNGTARQLWKFVLASEPLTDVKSNADAMPVEFTLEQNYPNPFNPETEISYSLPETMMVTLQIFNTKGQLVKTIVNSENQFAGTHRVLWDGTDMNGKMVTSGVYFYQLKTPNSSLSRSMLLIK